jgi:hypothetical protein
MNRGDGWKRDGSPSERTARHDACMRSSFGFANYPLYSDYFSQSTPAQIVVPSLLQATFSSPVPPLYFGPSLSSFLAHIGERRGLNEPSAYSASSQQSAHPPIEHSHVQPSPTSNHLSSLVIPQLRSLPTLSSSNPSTSTSPARSFPLSPPTSVSGPKPLYPITSLLSLALASLPRLPLLLNLPRQHSDWYLPFGAYSVLSAPEKKKARNVFASMVWRGRRRKSSGYWRAR